ncbi:hypothetical protein BDM02DRAFT_3154903 [Thelephora ganbajun]|uniref:Uncharacterized protein n=1 Tax=Thelephora ganbajun TaxID=370292 RepID=A0ACB6ZM96_THEGA|nr:hypothetical protein BDM02DRAFT_3154903 [Thelephora ganbajun]
MAHTRSPHPHPPRPTIAQQHGEGTDKVTLSRALGAAFLSHQVEQLEKSANNRIPGTANRRDRRVPHSDQGGRNSSEKHHNSPAALTSRRVSGSPPKQRIDDRPLRDSPDRKQKRGQEIKDADVIVLDASVLIHALGQLKKWSRDNREEIIIVPLEVLNTLDLLKKGTSPLSQRARAASRVLEAQVGTNPRIRVQQDDAFVSWEAISFSTNAPNPLMGSPEWLRRTICCACWEAGRPAVQATSPDTGGESRNANSKLVFAVIAQNPEPVTLAPKNPPLVESPVPLPTPHVNRFEPRTTGTLAAYWATRAGLNVLEVQPAREDIHNNRKYEDPDGTSRNRKTTPHQTNGKNKSGGALPILRSGKGLVERPPAVKAMMDMVSQPSRVVRVLARGEKLEPDT